MQHFIPMKITQKRYADKFVQGEVFMRALHEFGSWGDISNKDDVLKNDYRGDLYSGVTAVFASPATSGYFAKIARDKPIEKCCLIDESDIQYFKILSLYCWELDEATQRFRTPAYRMMNFGDTAVVITDFCEFLERYALALFGKYPTLTAMVDTIQVFDFSETRLLNPLFCKHESQAYQNELRLAFGVLEKDFFARGPGADSALSMVMNHEPVKLQLGDLSDITLQISIDDFMLGNLPNGFRCRWPSSDDPKNPSNFDSVRAWTREQMNKYRSICVKPAYLRDGDMCLGETMSFEEFVRQSLR